MGIVKDEWSPSSSGLAMAGSKEPLVDLYSQRSERAREESGGKLKGKRGHTCHI